MALKSSTRNAQTSAIVTGGGQGVGLAIAEQLAAEGCRKLALIGRTPEKLENAAAAFAALGATVATIAADVSDAARLRARRPAGDREAWPRSTRWSTPRRPRRAAR